MKKLHFGCGPRYLPGYIHVDAQKYPHVEHVVDITQDLSHIFGEESIDEIYACHVLEHISRREIVDTLSNWNKLLKPGGILRLAVPNLEAVIEKYIEDSNNLFTSLLGLVYGGQRDKYDFHTIGFDLTNLSRLLAEVGFAKVKPYSWQEFLPSDYDDYSKAYLPHGNTETGKLMSLNVTAEKVSMPLLQDTDFLRLVTKKEIQPFFHGKEKSIDN